ncbi:MAG: hypothetical protein AB7T22_07115 [Calditrichaceae bacterium]
MTTDGSLTYYAAGYDADGNYIGDQLADWTTTGSLDAASSAGTTSFTFNPTTAPTSGTIEATFGAFSDATGVITVSEGAVSYVKIRDAANNNGNEIGAVNLTVGQTLYLYAAGYDSENNFSADVAVDWHATGTLDGLGDSISTSSTTLTPFTAGSGEVNVTNINGWTNDATGTITVQSGALKSLKIRTAANNGGSELGNYSGKAGDNLDLFAAGYDSYENYLGDQTVAWSVDGDSIGVFSQTDSSTSNNITFTTVNTSQIKISRGALNDYSGVIKVRAGDAFSAARISPETVSGKVNDFISDSLGVMVTDAYGNLVPSAVVTWSTPSDGSLNPVNDVTDSQGISRSKWHLMTTVGTDTARAQITGIGTPIEFYANTLTSTADSLKYFAGGGQTDIVGQELSQQLTVQVIDSLGNPVSGVSVTFSLTSHPADGGHDFIINPVSAASDAGGFVRTTFTLGTKVGDYVIAAYNSQLLNSPVSFTVSATADVADRLVIVSGNNQTGTAGSALALSNKIRAVDAYDNPVQGAIINWAAAADGSVNHTGLTTNASGLDSVTWTLQSTAGADLLTASSPGLTDVNFNATVNPATGDHFIIISSQDSIKVGTSRLLEVALEDAFNNRVSSGQSVTFNRLHGNGLFGNGSDVISKTTDNNGIASALYTVSDSLTYVRDSVEVVFGGVKDTIVLPLKAGNVSYYTFTPSGNNSITAGGSVGFTLTARDQFGNPVINNDQITLSAPGSATAVFSGGPFQFSNSSTLNFSVSDDTKGSFIVRAAKTINTEIKGESGLITVNAAAADHFVIISSQDAITTDTERLLQVGLEDVYNNRLPALQTVTFRRFNGNGLFSNGLDNINDDTDAGGIAEARYTASDSLYYLRDSVEVSFGGILDTIILPLKAGKVSYYTFTPSGDNTITAGGNVAFTLTARDQNGNEVVNSDQVTLSAVGSATAVFAGGPFVFSSSSTLAFSVSETKKGSFTVRAVKSTSTDVKGESGLITVNPAALNYVLVRTEANNGGVEFADSTFTADNLVNFFSAGYDQYDNYRSDVVVNWTSLGGLDPVTSTGSKFAFNPVLAGVTGQIVATHSTYPTVDADTSGIITVNPGSLAELRVQIDDLDDGTELGDSTITADDFIDVYAVGYDADGNYRGRVSSNWTRSGAISAISPANPTDSLHIEATLSGTGSVRATAVSNTSVYDNAGLITVNPGAVSYVKIRTESNNGGIEIGDSTLAVGQVLSLYSAGYDSDNNFSQNAPVNWNVTGGLTGLGNSTNVYVTTLTPTSPGSGAVQVTNSNGWTNDATGTITVQTGELASIRIQTTAGAGGTELGAYTAAAGGSLDLYAAGYDVKGNYISPANVSWTVDGDSIGAFTQTDSAATNTINFTVANSSQIKITRGSLNDYSGIIKVRSGAAFAITKITPDTVSGRVSDFISDSLGIRVVDAYNNLVPAASVTWSTNSDGVLNPVSDATDTQGVSRSKWRLKTTVGLDSASAAVAGIATPVIFYANALSSSANTLVYVSGDSLTGTVQDTLAQPFVVRVEDNFGNPVAGVSVTFSVTDHPVNAEHNFNFTQESGLSDAYGNVQTFFQLGSMTGEYQVSAFNSQLNNSPIKFTAFAVPDTAAQILIVSGNNQTGTVGQPLVQYLKVRSVDAYNNPVQGVTINWTPSLDGGVDHSGLVTNASGLDSVIWTLRTVSGNDTLTVDSPGKTPVIFNALVNADVANTIVAYSGNNRTSIAGGNQQIVAQVQDQFGNMVKDQTVQFIPTQYISNLTDKSDENGLAHSLYTSPKKADSSFAKAYITGLIDTAAFKIYGIRYVSNSLEPKVVMPGDTTTFYVKVSNPGIDIVPLDTSLSSFIINDTDYSITAKLDSPLALPPRSPENLLKFKPAIINGGFLSGKYTPEIHLVGREDYSGMNGTLSTDAVELSIEPLRIVSVTVLDPASKIVRKSDTINMIQMRIRNTSMYTIRDLSADLTFTPDYGFSEVQLSGPDSLLSDSDGIFEFSLNIPSGATPDTIIVDGTVMGRYSGTGDLISDTESSQTDQFIIANAAVLTFADYTPKTVSAGQNVQFAAQVKNDGVYDVLLNKTSTSFEFGGQKFNLTTNQALAGGGSTTTLNFTATNLTIPGDAKYEGLLVLNGTENGAAFNDSLTAADSLVVQNPAVLQINSVIASGTDISQGVDTLLTIDVTNTGQALLRIDSLVVIPYGVPVSIAPGLPNTLTGGETRPFDVRVTVPTGPDTGLVTIDARGKGIDINSGSEITTASAVATDSWNVYTPPVISITQIAHVNPADSLVSQGQSKIPVSVTIRNSGGTPVSINNLNLIAEIGLYTNEWPAFPIPLAGHSEITITDSVSVQTNSATGHDTLYASIKYQNNFSGKSSSLTSASFMAWEVTGKPLVEIISVSAVKDFVSQGQTSVNVSVRVKNVGTSPARVETLALQYQNGNENYVFNPVSPILPRTIDSGLSQVFTVPVDINFDAQTGPDTMYASINLTELLSQQNFDITDTTVTDTWQVQLRPQVVIDSVTVAPQLVSTNQSNLRAAIYMSNAAGPYRADAQVDSVRLKLMTSGAVERNDLFTISRNSSPSIPLILKPGSSTRFDFNLATLGGTLSDIYSVDGYTGTRDVNDGMLTIQDGAVIAGSLTVEQQALLAVNSVAVLPDTVSQGQTHARLSISVSNSGEADAVINSNQLSVSPPINLGPVLISHSTPFNLSGGLTDTLIYSLVIPSGYTGTVGVNNTISGKESNSGADLSASSGSPGQFFIETPAALSVFETIPNASPGDTTIQFRLKVVNRGEATVELDSNLTSIEIQGTSYLINLAGTSPQTIKAFPDTTELVFRSTLITAIQSQEYPLRLHVRGASNKAAYQSDHDAGIFAYGAGLISITSIGIVGDNRVIPGQTGIQVIMTVSNSGIPLQIDPAGTTLIMKSATDGSIRNVNNLNRTDTLTVLKTSSNNRLIFVFDLPDPFPLGQTNIFGQISLDNGNLVKESSTFEDMIVLSKANISYVLGSMNPDTLVRRQTNSFAFTFYNAGSADLALDPDSSYMEILSSPISRKYLAGKFTLGGLDSTEILFNSLTVPVTMDTVIYNVKWRLKGTLLNGSDYEKEETIFGVLKIIPEARLIFTQINILPETVRQGQNDIAIDYTLANLGKSSAAISKIDHIFNAGAADVSTQWLPSTFNLFPDTLMAGQSRTYSINYNLSQSATTGIVKPRPIVSYRDLRTSTFTDTSKTVIFMDSVLVIRPAIVGIDSLKIIKDVLAPNAPYVNQNESFNLRLRLVNNGADTIRTAYVSLSRDDNFLQQLVMTDIAPFNYKTMVYNSPGLAIDGSTVYKVKIDSAIDLTGSLVTIQQPVDNLETVLVQTASRLALNAAIISPVGAVDGIISVGTKFKVRADVSRVSGVSSYGSGKMTMSLPDTIHYKFDSDISEKTFTQSQAYAEWNLEALSVSTGGIFDSLRIQMNEIPIDLNTGRDVTTVKTIDTVLVRTDEAGIVTALISIASPDGARDSVISTGQEFVLHTEISFNQSVRDTGRVAQILLPSGFSVKTSSIKDLPATSTAVVDWEIVATGSPTPGTVNISVRIIGYDKNSGQLVETTSNLLPVQVVLKSSLVLGLKIVEPAGATDDTVSVGQTLKLEGLVTLQPGTAAISGTGKTSILLSPEFTLIDPDTQKTFTVGTPFYWWVRVDGASTKSAASMAELKSILNGINSKNSSPGQETGDIEQLDGRISGTDLQKVVKDALIVAAAAKESYQITVKVDSIPLDVNTQKPATINETQTKTIYTEEGATLSIVSTESPDTVSTGQTFIYRVTGQISSNLANPVAYLLMPEKFGGAVIARSLDINNQATWDIAVPADYTGTGKDTIAVFLTGIDRNSGEVTDPTSLVANPLTVQKRPKLSLKHTLISPVSSQAGLLSFGQEVIVELWAEYAENTSGIGYADVQGSGAISLDSALIIQNGFTLVEGETYKKTFTQLGQKLVWRIKAPLSERTVSINFNFTGLPSDKNSGLSAEIDVMTGLVSLPVRVRQKNITVLMLNDLIVDRSFLRGMTDRAILAFSISNQGYEDNLNVNAVEIGLYSTFGLPTADNLLNQLAIANMMKSLKVVNYDQYKTGLTKNTAVQRPKIFAEYQLDESSDNPVWMDFSLVDTLEAGAVDTIIVLAELQTEAENRSFRTVLKHVNAYDVDPSVPLAIKDAQGVDINESQSYTSEAFTVISSNPEEAFRNYPNPFGRNEEFTTIVFQLDHDSDVEIRIFTLLGELVWTKILPNQIAGLHYDDVRWNGKNDRGYVVLNGVYLCAIDIKPKSGGSRQTFITKIAYIK